MTTQNKNFKFNKRLFITTFINSVFDGKVDLDKVYVLHGFRLRDILRGSNGTINIETYMYLPAILRNETLPDDFKQNVINQLLFAILKPNTRAAEEILDVAHQFAYRESTSELFNSIPTEKLKYRYWKKFLDFTFWDIAHDIFYNTYATIDDKFDILTHLSYNGNLSHNGNWLLCSNISGTDAVNVIKTVWKDIKPKIQHALETNSRSSLYKINHFSALFGLVMRSDENMNILFRINTIKDLEIFDKEITDVLPKVLTQTKEDIEYNKNKKKILNINERISELAKEREKILLQMAGFNKNQKIL